MEKIDQRLRNVLLLGFMGWTFLFSALFPFDAKAQKIKLISDEEIEVFLGSLISPLFKAAGLSFHKDNIFIVDDNSLNAFVADGNSLFIHTGTIIKAETSNELSGVLAHETGHIMGGHILRQKLKNKELSTVSLISAVLAGTTAVLGGRGDAAMAVFLGGQSSTLNHYMAYRTSEERSADESAVKLLSKTNQSPVGILNFMKKILKENTLSGREETPYLRTHPVTTERISFFEKVLSETKIKTFSEKDDAFLRVKAKLKAYLLSPEQTLRDYPLTQNDVPSEYAHVIVFLKQLKFDAALQKINSLLQRENQNPYFYELKGEILLETGKIKQAKEAFIKAYTLLPQSDTMKINYAQTLLEDSPTNDEAKKAAQLLQSALTTTHNGYAWIFLSQAYGLTGNMAGATYAAAEYSYRLGNFETAQKQIDEALTYPASKQLKLKIEDLKLRLTKLEKD